jgi:hypothetical protein
MKKIYKKTKKFQKGYLQIKFYVVNYGKNYTVEEFYSKGRPIKRAA